MTIRKGRHMICASDVRSEGELMACAIGWCRNRARLARELGLNEGSALADIVINAYRRWGTDYPEHIEGPTATVLIDRSAERMVASRDRMGERRLFYCRHGRIAAVADHPDALLESPYATAAVDAAGLNELFAIGPARTPGRTPYRDILELEPGCALVAQRSGVSVYRYYRMNACINDDEPEQAACRVRELLEQAVEDIIHMADSAMLSGGLDSTVLAALMKSAGHPLRTFSVDYLGDEQDFTGNEFQPERDRDYAEMAAELFSAEHKNIVLTHSELARSLGAAMDARGFPGMGDIDSSLLVFVRRISGSACNVVSGECSDEVFCGYPWFSEHSADFFPWSGSMDLRRSILRPDIAEILRPEKYAREAYRNAVDTAPRVIGEPEEDAALRRLQWLCFRFFMSNLQERALCMCERSSVNVFTPFCDERLAEYVWNAPRSVKFMNGQSKGLLREAVRDILPDALLNRRKSPYPKVYSREYTAAMRGMVAAVMADPTSPVMKVLDHQAVRALVESDLPAGGLPWFGQLMSGPQLLAYIWQVNEWMRTRKVGLII